MEEIAELLEALTYIKNITQTSLCETKQIEVLTNIPWIDKWINEIGNKDIRIDWSAEWLTIYGKHNFIEYQNKYKKYFVNSTIRNTKYMAIAEIHSDPIFVDISSQQYSVFFSRHGDGIFTPKPLASSITSFVKAVKCWCYLYYEQYDRCILTDDYEVKSSLKDDLINTLGSFMTKDQIDTFLFAATA